MKSAYLFAVMVTIFAVAVSLPASYAQDAGITVTSSALERTVIVNIHNSAAADVHSVKLWIDEANSFESFKTSGGWTGSRQIPSLLVFSASEPMGAGESAKFGIVTASPAAGINWQVLDAADAEITRNVTVPVESAPLAPDTPTGAPNTDPDPEVPESGILDGSVFRIVPTSPNIGSQIRVAGDGFEAQSTVSLLMGPQTLGQIETGDSGRFVYTVRIPDSVPADRVEFRLTDGEGDTLQRSVRIGEAQTRMIHSESQGLTLNDIPAVVTAGDTVNFGGSGTPGEFIVVTLVHPDEYAIRNSQIRIDSNGLWSSQFQIPATSVVGRYAAVVTDGAATLRKSWDVETGAIINVLSTKLSYDPGDILIFRGSATPDAEMIVRLVNPQNIVLYEDAIDIDGTGSVGFEIPTDTGYSKGTYTLLLSQGNLEKVIPVGLGGRAENLFVIKTDKLNYSSNESAVITVHGTAGSEATLSVSDTAKHKTILTVPIILDANGLYLHTEDLKDYSKAIYTVTVSYGKISSDHSFSVGFMHNAGALEVSTIKSSYEPREPIIVIGSSVKNSSLVDISLVSPDGTEVQTITEFSIGRTTTNSKRNTAFFNTVFFVHSNYEHGLWKVIAKSGNSIAETPFEVVLTRVKGLIVELTEIDTVTGSSILINGSGATPGTQLEIAITYNLSDPVGDTLLVRSTGSGTFSTEWLIDDPLFPGTYTIAVSDLSGGSASVAWIVE